MSYSFYSHSRFATLLISGAFSVTSYSQYNLEKELLIIPCKTGTLFIDGVEAGRIEADDAFRKKLSYGEHYLQLKTGAEKVNQTVIIDSLSKGIIRIGCEAAVSSGQAPNPKRLFEKQINLTGLIATETDENIFALDTGDEIILNCDVLNKKGSVNITIQEYEKKVVIYQKERVSLVTGDRIRVPAKGVYQLTLQTQALLGKDVQVSIDRIPGINSSTDFNTVVKIVYDTIQTPFLTTRGRVYSTTNGKSSKVVVPVQLPPNTSYWVYWIGLGEQSANELKSMTANLAKISQVIYPDPLVYYGLKLITALPVLNTPSTITYFFADNRNADAFIRSQPSVRFGDLPMGNNISNAYSIINKNKSDLALILFNESSFTGVDFEVRAVAFMVKPRYVVQN